MKEKICYINTYGLYYNFRQFNNSWKKWKREEKVLIYDRTIITENNSNNISTIIVKIEIIGKINKDLFIGTFLLKIWIVKK